MKHYDFQDPTLNHYECETSFHTLNIYEDGVWWLYDKEKLIEIGYYISEYEEIDSSAEFNTCRVYYFDNYKHILWRTNIPKIEIEKAYDTLIRFHNMRSFI